MGRLLASTLNDKETHSISILSRNKFLASAPSKVSEAFGWLGESFLEANENVRIRDWDGGDLLDIVGCDWMGWQEDVLKQADVVVNMVGGYTEQRSMACERIVRESLSVNPGAKQIIVSMSDKDLQTKLKIDRAKLCEDMLLTNCPGSHCIRAEMYDVDGACEQIMGVIEVE
jgi:hypothetical protein